VISFIDSRQPVDSYMESYLKLSANLQENNMVLFDARQKLCKFSTVQEIVEVFYEERIKAYRKRKDYLISRFEREYEILTSKINFIK
jgi:DNA topoisomerase-2